MIDHPVSGILVARRDLILRDRAELRGLLLHLGEGQLTLRDQSQVFGGIWMSDMKSGSIALQVSDDALIRYDSDAISAALRLLPPTQLGWRILHPETVG